MLKLQSMQLKILEEVNQIKTIEERAKTSVINFNVEIIKKWKKVTNSKERVRNMIQ